MFELTHAQLKTMRWKLLLIIFLFTSPVLVSSSPEKRIGPSMVYDPIDHRVLLFGGAHWQNRYTFYDELWSYEYETNTWSMLDTRNNPDPRFNSMLVYIPDRHQLFLYGGFSSADRIADTWVYDFESNTWTELHPNTQPSPRSDSSIAYDPVNDVVVLFSGYLLNDTHLQDTWIYSFKMENWIKRTPDNPPLGQYGNYMVYVESTGQLLMYPGHWSVISNGETVNHGFGGNLWEYDVVDDSWIEHSSNVSPPGRYWGSLVYDSTEDRLILFGGHGAVNYDDTWTYSVADGVWENVEQSIKPSRRNSIGAVYDPDNHVVVLFGGLGDDRQSLEDTWILDCETLTWHQPETSTTIENVPEENNPNSFIPGFPVWTIILAVFLYYIIIHNTLTPE